MYLAYFVNLSKMCCSKETHPVQKDVFIKFPFMTCYPHKMPNSHQNLPLGAWDGLRYFIVALPEPSI